MAKKVIFGILLILQMTVIFLFSAQNSVDSADTSHGFTRIIAEILCKNMPEEDIEQNVLYFDFAIRKTAHFTIYFVLGIFACLFFIQFVSKKRKVFGLTVLLCMLYAVTDEIHQYFVPGRACRILDVCIDTLGAITGCIVVMTVIYVIKRKKQRLKY